MNQRGNGLFDKLIRWRERYAAFMCGRYGVDELTRALMILSMILLIASWLVRNIWFSLFVVLIIVIEYYRVFSRKIQKRYRENQLYLRVRNKVQGFFRKVVSRCKQQKTHRFFKCPCCKQKVRVPKGHGRIQITCPKCREQFIRKS